MNTETVLSGKTIVLFLDLAKQKEAILISTALVKKGAKVLVFSEKEKLDNFLWVTTSKNKPYAIVFDENIIDAGFTGSIADVGILSASLSFPKNYPPVVVADEGPLNLFLRDLFLKQTVHLN